MEDIEKKPDVSVFTFLFSQPEYTRELYLALHPEETGVSVDECKVIALDNVLGNERHDTLCIQAKGRIVLLMEAQSLISENVALLMLTRLSEVYDHYAETHMLDLYSEKNVRIPAPELFVVYTGQEMTTAETLQLSSLYSGGDGAELRVTVRQDTGKGDILDQYVRFCKIAEKQRGLYGRSRKAAEETIRLCTGKGVLVNFLASRGKEVQSILEKT